MGAMGNSYNMDEPLRLTIRTSDVGNKTPITVKFDVMLGSQTRTYSYPYSSGNTYYWNDIDNFNYEGQTSYSISNARVEFTDGSVSLSSTNTNPGCMMSSLPD